MRGKPDWQGERRRYLVHFSDGGAGMRYRDERLTVDDVLNEGGQRYVVERVEEPPSPFGLGHAWVTPAEG
jgi:hypothetical protein